MSLTKFNKNINYHQSEPDQPAKTADEIKKLFDQAGIDIKEYINTVLTEEMDNIVNELEKRITANTNGKVDKVVGKGLSTNDFSNSYKTKLDGVATGATKNVVTDNLNNTNPINSLSARQGNILYQMINTVEQGLRKIIDKLASEKSNLITKATVSVDNKTITAGGLGTITISMAKSGYTCLGILGVNMGNASSSGANVSNCNIFGMYLSGTDAIIELKNMNSSNAAKIKITVYGLYVKN